MENILIAKLIAHPNDFYRCNLRVDDFINEHNKILYQKMLDKNASGHSWDMILLKGGLSSDSIIHMSSILEDDPGAPQSISGYCTEIIKIRSKDLVNEIVQQVGKDDPHEFSEALSDRLADLIRDTGPEPVGDILPRVFEKIEAALQDPNSTMGLQTGFMALDNILFGLIPGKMYVLGARPSMGKSSLGSNICMNIAKTGKRIYIQSLEESGEDSVLRLLSNSSGVAHENLCRANHHCELDDIVTAVGSVGELDIVIDDSGALSTDQIISRVKREHIKRNIDLIIVDHLQEIREKGDTRHLQISFACSRLKALAKSLEVPILLLCQLNRAVESEPQKIPKLRHLKESGDIEQIADIVMFLYRESYYRNGTADDPVNPYEADVFIAKHRGGRTGHVKLHWDPHLMKFSNFTPQEKCWIK